MILIVENNESLIDFLIKSQTDLFISVNQPYLNIKKPVLHVSPSMWKELEQEKKENEKNGQQNSRRKMMSEKIKRLNSFYQLVSENKGNFHFMKLFDDGYNDAKLNKKILDEIFLEDNSEF